MDRAMWKVLRADAKRHGGAKSGGFWALAVYRYGRWSLTLPNPAARWVTSKIYGVANQAVETLAGVDLDRRTEIGEGLHFIHTGMISIHPNVKMGERVGIMHGVTIGTNMGGAVPTIGNDVFIGCHSSILGGVTIGDGARIAANSLVTSDVPAGAFAVGVPARVIRS
jgi:serine O-acetyltransferase